MAVKEIQMWDIKKVKPYEKNPRLNDDAVDAVANSIKEFGFKNPIIVDKEGVIVCGHTRLKASKKLKLKQVPVIVADDLTDDQTKAYRLADNKTGELASWDIDMLDKELNEITDIDMSDFGFELDALADDPKSEDAQEDDFDVEGTLEGIDEPITQYGDIWHLGEHRLMCGDSTKAEDVAKLMNGEKADLVITDPPYNVNYGDKDSKSRDIANDNFKTDKEAGEILWKPTFVNMRKFANDCCSIYCFMPQGGAHMMMMMMMHEALWQVKHELVWVKNSMVLGKSDYQYMHEPILYGWNKTRYFTLSRREKSVIDDKADLVKMNKADLVKYCQDLQDVIAKSVIRENKPQKNDLHPTMKPVKLIAYLMGNSSTKDQIVIDLFGGSGTTLIACEQMSRKCRMMELDRHYCDVIVKRWETLTGKKAEREER